MDVKARWERTKDNYDGIWLKAAEIFAQLLTSVAGGIVIYGGLGTFARVIFVDAERQWGWPLLIVGGVILALIADELEKGIRLRRAQYRQQRLEESYSGRHPTDSQRFRWSRFD